MSDCKLKLSYCHSVCWERFQACWYYHEGFTGPAWVVAKCRWWFFFVTQRSGAIQQPDFWGVLLCQFFSSRIPEVYCCANFWSDCAVFKQFSLSGNQCLSPESGTDVQSVLLSCVLYFNHITNFCYCLFFHQSTSAFCSGSADDALIIWPWLAPLFVTE